MRRLKWIAYGTVIAITALGAVFALLGQFQLAVIAVVALFGLTACASIYLVSISRYSLAHLSRLDRSRNKAQAKQSEELLGLITQQTQKVRDQQVTERNTVIAELTKRLDKSVADVASELSDAGAASSARLIGMVDAGRWVLDELHDFIVPARNEGDGHMVPPLGTGLAEALAEPLRNQLAEMKSRQDREFTRVIRSVREETQATQALLQLLPLLSPRWALPPLGISSLDAGTALHLAEMVRSKRPRTIVELGSGTSTVLLGYLLEESGGRVVSLEHLSRFKSRTDTYVELHQLSSVVETRLAPLERLSVGGQEFDWYSANAFAGLADIDLLLVDGPPASVGRWSRYPALPILKDRLADGALVLLDDATRPEEEEIVSKWEEEVPGLRRIHEGISRLAVFRYEHPGEYADDAGTTASGAS